MHIHVLCTHLVNCMYKLSVDRLISEGLDGGGAGEGLELSNQ